MSFNMTVVSVVAAIVLSIAAAGIRGVLGFAERRQLPRLLVQIEPTDPLTCAAAGAPLFPDAALACFLLAPSAIAMDPADGVRHE